MGFVSVQQKTNDEANNVRPDPAGRGTIVRYSPVNGTGTIRDDAGKEYFLLASRV